VALNIKHFFIVLLSVSIAAAVLLKPFDTIKVKHGNLPQLKFVSFESFEITKKGVESIGFGSEALKYEKKVTIKFPKFMRQTDKGVEKVFANRGEIVEDLYIKLYDSVELHRNDNLIIKSSKIVYDMKTNIYSTQGDKFEAYYKEDVITGEDLKYNRNSGKIFADKIYAKIYDEDR